MHMVGSGFQQFSHAGTAVALVILGIPWSAFWPNFAGLAALAIGLPSVLKSEARHAGGLDKVIQFGPLLFAIGMAIFGADHFVAAKFVATIVPSWIPAHLFWAYFVGVALIAAALSLVTNRQTRLAAALLSLMIFLFVLTIHLPAFLATPHDKTKFIILLRDLALSSGACAFAASQTEHWRTHGTHKIITAACFIMAIVAVVFGVENILFPTLAPGIPQENSALFITMPSWIPGHVFWAYLAGAVLIASGLGLTIKTQARLAASCIGILMLFLLVFVYLPLVIAKPLDIANALNYLAIHSALAGAALLLAGALAKAEYRHV